MSAFIALAAAGISAFNTFQISNLDRREKVEEASYKFAQLFVEKVLATKKLEDHQKTVQAMLTILDIVAQASEKLLILVSPIPTNDMPRLMPR